MFPHCPFDIQHIRQQNRNPYLERFICLSSRNLSNYVKEERAGGDDHNLILINHISTSRMVAAPTIYLNLRGDQTGLVCLLMAHPLRYVSVLDYYSPVFHVTNNLYFQKEDLYFHSKRKISDSTIYCNALF